MNVTESTLNELRTVKAIIRRFMEVDLRCRNSDKWLTYKVYEYIAEKNGKKIFIPFELFDKFPAFESVKRMRALIQNKEKALQPTDPDVWNRRKIRQKAVEQFVI
jgi:hypothetical protein